MLNSICKKAPCSPNEFQYASGSRSAIVTDVKEVYKNVESSYVSLILCEGDAADEATMIDYSKTGANKVQLVQWISSVYNALR